MLMAGDKFKTNKGNVAEIEDVDIIKCTYTVRILTDNDRREDVYFRDAHNFLTLGHWVIIEDSITFCKHEWKELTLFTSSVTYCVKCEEEK